jgi:hypothetical protein
MYNCEKVKLHHRRPQTVGGFKKCFGEQGQRHEIAATGLMKISAKSATDHFVYVYFVRLCLLCCNARCRKTTKEASDVCASIWFQRLELSSIGLSNWMWWKHRRMKVKDDLGSWHLEPLIQIIFQSSCVKMPCSAPAKSFRSSTDSCDFHHRKCGEKKLGDFVLTIFWGVALYKCGTVPHSKDSKTLSYRFP